MNRRQILKYAAGLSTLAIVKPAVANDFVEFSDEIYNQALEEGQPFMLGFLSDW